MSLSISLNLKFEDDLYVEFFSTNITHNLVPIWEKCSNLYDLLYNSTGKLAKEISDELIECYKILLENPNEFKKYESENGYGTLEQGLHWLLDLILKLKEYPELMIGIYK